MKGSLELGHNDQERFGFVDISGGEGRAKKGEGSSKRLDIQLRKCSWCLVKRKKVNLEGSYMWKSHVVENNVRLELKQNKGDLGKQGPEFWTLPGRTFREESDPWTRLYSQPQH